MKTPLPLRAARRQAVRYAMTVFALGYITYICITSHLLDCHYTRLYDILRTAISVIKTPIPVISYHSLQHAYIAYYI